jgi:CheY-like chemotaxis protein
MGSKILIADDDTMVRLAIQKILSLFDHEVVAVESGRQVLGACRSWNIAVGFSSRQALSD